MHEPQQIAGRAGNTLIHCVIPSPVRLGLPVGEARLNLDRYLTTSSPDPPSITMLDTSLIALVCTLSTVRFQPAEILKRDRYHRDSRS